eukprot:TRINITY_DN8709_c0_g1_i1.p1 TRINITY_DN8709_c0_g1~~TRINITY_DN8709_c0_g1_i1.p1  ORF type:complete len:131 (+),score=39.34 TRINITY_DN8709_c0_g1_i1:89-481(+)
MCLIYFFFFFFFQAEDGIRDAQESRGLGDVYKRQVKSMADRIRKKEARILSTAERLAFLSAGFRAATAKVPIGSKVRSGAQNSCMEPAKRPRAAMSEKSPWGIGAKSVAPYSALIPVSYTHLTLPTKRIV